MAQFALAPFLIENLNNYPPEMYTSLIDFQYTLGGKTVWVIKHSRSAIYALGTLQFQFDMTMQFMVYELS